VSAATGSASAPSAGDTPQWLAIAGSRYRSDDPGLQFVLAQAHDAGERPLCLCVPGGVPMVVARLNRFVLKRMPDSGSRHHPRCGCFQPQAQCSGLGELLGTAILEHASGCTELRTDFSWSKRAEMAPETTAHGAAPVVRAQTRRISLRATLHFLFERAGFNRWDPAFQGRRTQAALCRDLMAAASDTLVHGRPLAERLYVPEPFSKAGQAEAAQRRRDHLRFLHEAAGDPMALVVGEYKACDEAEYGRRLWIRHMPDAPFLVADQDWARVRRAFMGVFEARDADHGQRTRVVAAMLVRARRENTYQVEAITMMTVTADWIPVEHTHELMVAAALVAQRRRFVKPLRYDARHAAAFANFLLLDVGAAPMRLDVLSDYLAPPERSAKTGAMARDGNAGWVWHTVEPMPALPAAA